MPALDKWLATVFDPANLDETCSLLAAADEANQPGQSRAYEVATSKVALCDQRLDTYRKTLDSGADPAVVAKWIADVQAERAAAEHVLATYEPVRPLSAAEVRQMVTEVEDKVRMLAEADPTTKAALYGSLGLTLTYDYKRRVVTAEAQPAAPCAYERVGGGT